VRSAPRSANHDNAAEVEKVENGDDSLIEHPEAHNGEGIADEEDQLHEEENPVSTATVLFQVASGREPCLSLSAAIMFPIVYLTQRSLCDPVAGGHRGQKTKSELWSHRVARVVYTACCGFAQHVGAVIGGEG